MLNDKRIHYIIALDEAQYLNNDILKDFKMLMNFYMDSKDCFSLVLMGQPVLNNILEKQIHESLKQRIVINYEFVGLSELEIKEYIDSRLSLVEASNKIIDDNAIKALHGCCSGSIRKLNSIITKALLIGAQHQKTSIDTDIVMAASNELSLR